jgi:phosphoribosylanthranilate isomerase
MWVKICGITNEEDALMAVAMGADAVGFVFAPSPRQVTVGTVRDITRRLPFGVMTVGVFRDQAPDQVIDTILAAGLHAAQLHGHETPNEARQIRQKAQALIVAFPAGSTSVARFDDYHADALMLDAQHPGSGEVFDWTLAEGIPSNRRLILAGGLTPANVTDAIATVRPWGVDVSSGVESEPGVKDARKTLAFIRRARSAFAELEEADEDEGREDGREVVAHETPGPFDWSESG